MPNIIRAEYILCKSFLGKVGLDISCESFADKKHQAPFFLKKRATNFEIQSGSLCGSMEDLHRNSQPGFLTECIYMYINMRVWMEAIKDLYCKCSKISNTFFFMFSNKMLVFWAGTHKKLVRIAIRENPDQTASSEAV